MTSSIRRALAARSCSAVTASSLGGHRLGHRGHVPHGETGVLTRLDWPVPRSRDGRRPNALEPGFHGVQTGPANAGRDADGAVATRVASAAGALANRADVLG